MPPKPRTLAALLVLMAAIAGCTTYTWPDGRRETVWGVPAEDTGKSELQRRAEGVRYRRPGEIPN